MNVPPCTSIGPRISQPVVWGFPTIWSGHLHSCKTVARWCRNTDASVHTCEKVSWISRFYEDEREVWKVQFLRTCPCWYCCVVYMYIYAYMLPISLYWYCTYMCTCIRRVEPVLPVREDVVAAAEARVGLGHKFCSMLQNEVHQLKKSSCSWHARSELGLITYSYARHDDRIMRKAIQELGNWM